MKKRRGVRVAVEEVERRRKGRDVTNSVPLLAEEPSPLDVKPISDCRNRCSHL
jgi:hypothetical protein